jgi:hypothetical protein
MELTTRITPFSTKVNITKNVVSEGEPFDKYLITIDNEVLGYTYTVDEAKAVLVSLVQDESAKLAVAGKINAKVEISEDKMKAKLSSQKVGYVYNGAFYPEHTFSIVKIPKIDVSE